MNADEILQEVTSQVMICERCNLCKTRKNAVPGTGPSQAEILFIGEGPGHNENESGLPFVGAAGKFLTDMLSAAGYERSAVFITNVVKCRPPDNRDPLPEELEACAGYLERQIAAINPVIIVTLGRFSMARYFTNVRISEIHGRPKWIDGRLIIPMFHPAAALHQPPLRKTIEQDFSRLPHWINKVKEKLEKDAQAKISPPVEPAEPSDQAKQLSLFG
jgi:uracil-DNA glycosylase family 4